MTHANKVRWLRFALVAGSILLIEGLCRFGVIKPMTLLAPSAMVIAFIDLVRAGKVDRDIMGTLGNVTASFVLAVIVGAALGVVIHALPRLRRMLDPLLASYYAVPFFVFYPLFIVVFGMNDRPIIAIGFLFALVAMIIATLNGIDRIPPVLLKVARMHGMGRLRTALLLQLPAAAPSLFTGVKLAVAYAFIGVIAAEFILSGSGLGYAIAYAYNNFDNKTMYGLMLFVLVLVTAVNMVLHSWEQHILKRRGGR